MTDDILLSAKDLSVRFGGVLAVNNVSFDVKRGEVFTLIGPNGAGKTTVFNLISRIYTPTTGSIHYAGPDGTLKLTEQPPHRIARLGIARTFQNIELFEHATVLQNLLIAATPTAAPACGASCCSPARRAPPRSRRAPRSSR
ncbi:putative ABC transporter ATP-binding protein [Hydrogenophaga sp. T4]|nr:putative ABC transporter ATP-binding protein [Hydrogenophaga sp. T4]